jgi:hypothetical protein
MAQHRGVAPGCPGRTHRRQQRHPRLVFEHDQRVLAPAVFSVAASAT